MSWQTLALSTHQHSSSTHDTYTIWWVNSLWPSNDIHMPLQISWSKLVQTFWSTLNHKKNGETQLKHTYTPKKINNTHLKIFQYCQQKAERDPFEQKYIILPVLVIPALRLDGLIFEMESFIHEKQVFIFKQVTSLNSLRPRDAYRRQ